MARRIGYVMMMTYCNVPEVGGAICRGCCKHGSVGRELDIVDGVVMTLQRRNFVLLEASLPQPGMMIARAGHKEVFGAEIT